MSGDGSVATRGASVVLVGAFNPLILTPGWLADNDVVEAFELEDLLRSGRYASTTELALMEFRTFSVQVDRDRVQVTSTSELETPSILGDIVVNIFTLLGHTPVRAVGMNHHLHRSLPEDERDAILDRYASRSPMRDVVNDAELSTLVFQGRRADDYAGFVQVTLEPSHVVTGVYIALNDHIDLGSAGSGSGAAQILADEWQASLTHAEQLIDDIIEGS